MNDEKLKSLLKQDTSAPTEPSNQWSSILNKIESKKGINLRWLLPASALASVLAVLLIKSPPIEPKSSIAQEQELIEFFLEDFYGEEEVYSWLDND